MSARLIAKHAFGPGMTVDRYRLDNGLTLLIQADHAAPVFAFQTWFSVGSRHEKVGKTGIAHLLEHLMFHQTKNHPMGEYDALLEEAGAENNAATYLDWTYYMVNAPSDALDLVVELEADRMLNLSLDDDQVLVERDVVANERRQTVDDDVDGLLSETLYAHAFDRHGYRWPTIGTAKDIAGLTPDDCRQFYADYYAPNNATIVVAGDVDHEALIERIETLYGPMAASQIPSEPDRSEDPNRLGKRRDLTLPCATHRLCFAYPSPALDADDHPTLELVSEVLYGGSGSRMQRALVRETEFASSVRSYVGPFAHPSIMETHITGRQGVTAEQLLDACDQVLSELKDKPIDEAELQRARARLELGVLQSMEGVAGRAEQIGFYETTLADPGALFGRLRTYASITPAKAQRIASAYLDPRQRTVLCVAPNNEDANPDPV